MDSIQIGRSSECDICVTGDPTVSGVHCRISRVGNQYVFENLGRNGSTINGAQITGRVVVQPGSRVQIGAKTMLPWVEIQRLMPLGSVNVAQQTPRTTPYGGAQQTPLQPAAQPERFHFGWFILSLLVPIVGLILFLVWRTSRPYVARQCCLIPCIIGFGIDLTFSMISAAL